MAEELVVREPFALPGDTPRIFQVGEHITDPDTIEKVRLNHAGHVRRRIVPDLPPADFASHEAEG